MKKRNIGIRRVYQGLEKYFHFYNRVVPLDNFMIYKDIIRLDRPD
ncbi:MAG: hypothetical protein [Olavius algarvensis Gamma 1 endosymbiont]|nr:MAG: hypothetical protein [Olavius algarvensis Gamma 1 endosymbiont]